MFIIKAQDENEVEWLRESVDVTLAAKIGFTEDGDAAVVPTLCTVDPETGEELMFELQQLHRLIVENSEGRTIHNYKIMHNCDGTYSFTSQFGVKSTNRYVTHYKSSEEIKEILTPQKETGIELVFTPGFKEGD